MFRHPPDNREGFVLVAPLALPSYGPPWNWSSYRPLQSLTAYVPRPHPPSASMRLMYRGPVSPITWASSSTYYGCPVLYAQYQGVMAAYQCSDFFMVFNIIHNITCVNTISIFFNDVFLYYVHFILFSRKPYFSSVVKCYML